MKKIMFNDKYCLTQAVVDGKKTQTRRIAKQQDWAPFEIAYANDDHCYLNSDTRPHYKVGEIVAIAQSYKEVIASADWCSKMIYKNTPGWSNKMFVSAYEMPHQIKITGVRVERLQNISDDDCMKEGIYKSQCGNKDHWMDAYYIHTINQPYCTPRMAFEELVDRVYGKRTWSDIHGSGFMTSSY